MIINLGFQHNPFVIHVATIRDNGIILWKNITLNFFFPFSTRCKIFVDECVPYLWSKTHYQLFLTLTKQFTIEVRDKNSFIIMFHNINEK